MTQQSERLCLFILVGSLLVSTFFFTPGVHAANLRDQISGQVNAGATSAGFGAAKDPRQIVAEVVNIALGVTGSVFIVLLLMAGYWYITAKGDESKVEKATKTIRGAIIGLIVVLMAYGITRFVSSRTQQALRDTQRSERTILDQNAFERTNPVR